MILYSVCFYHHLGLVLSSYSIELQMDDWSDSDEGQSTRKQPTDLAHALLEIRLLKERLESSQQELVDFRELVNKTSKRPDVDNDEALPPPLPRDDDTHYFESYDEQC